MTTEVDTLNNLPINFQYTSYGDGTETAVTMEETQTSSPSASAYADWLHEKQELMSQIEHQAQLLERIQSDLQAKISRSKDLEDQLAQALEMAHTRDVKFEEMMEKFEILMNSHHHAPNNTAGTLLPLPANTMHQELPTTPERAITEFRAAQPRPTPAPSPPTKKQNNNASPHRNIYALFRQPQGKLSTAKNPPPSRHIARKLYSTSATLQIDTDEDSSRQPAPGAKPGEKLE